MAIRHDKGLAQKLLGKNLVCITQYQCLTHLCQSNGLTSENCPQILKDTLQEISGYQFS